MCVGGGDEGCWCKCAGSDCLLWPWVMHDVLEQRVNSSLLSDYNI